MSSRFYPAILWISWSLLFGLVFMALFPGPLRLDNRPCPPEPATKGRSFERVDPRTEAHSLLAVSLNIDREMDPERMIEHLKAYELLPLADLFLLQEVNHLPPPEPGVTERLAEALGMKWAFAPGDVWEGGELHGLAILSRFPLREVETVALEQFEFRFRNRCRIALAATVEAPFGPFRVFNVHLDTRLRRAERLRQLAPVLDRSLQFSGPQLLGGDFNTADIYWFWRFIPIPFAQQHKRAVRDSLHGYGFETPFEDTLATFDLFGLRLDWIYLKDLTGEDPRVKPINFSDHRALVVRVRAPRGGE